jgi:polyhydroxyalkanoate synthesis regulator phasin
MLGALNLVRVISPESDGLYRKRAEQLAYLDYQAVENLGEFGELLSSLLADIKLGLVSSVSNRARAETFADFLDHAEAYQGEDRKREAGVIAGVVFEDSLRRICDKYGIAQKGQKLEDLINALVKIGTLNQAKAKRAKAAAHVRTKATHAQWDEFNVKATIDLTREIIADKLA